MSVHKYNVKFYDYAAKTSAYTAEIVSSYLFPPLCPDSVLDVGCASGTWLHEWKRRGVSRIHGVDGYVAEAGRLQISLSNYQTMDLNNCTDLGVKYDLVQSLEVAEHLYPSSSEAFIDFLTDHANRFIIFSAAPVGQGGESHINERPYEYWRSLFRARGFSLVDAIRPILVNDSNVSYWYRYNLFLYVRDEFVPSLDGKLLQYYIDNGKSIKDISPFGFRIRKKIIGQLPHSLQLRIARLKAKYMPTGKF